MVKNHKPCVMLGERENILMMMHYAAGYYKNRHDYERKRVASMPVSNYAHGDLFKFCWCLHIAHRPVSIRSYSILNVSHLGF